MSAAPSDMSTETCDVRSFVAFPMPTGGTDVRAGSVLDGDEGEEFCEFTHDVSKGAESLNERGLSGAGSRWGGTTGRGVWSFSNTGDTSRSGTAVLFLARGSTYESDGVGGKGESWVDDDEEEWVVDDATRES